MTGAGQQPKNKLADSETQELKNIQVENILNEQKDIHTNRLTVDTRTARELDKK